ncbi:MAG: hypothetical protein RBU21_08130 [FCB group bacterium]|jgi:hypothetical protein|nr:hypothetical protein [FCB group bacterium]
MDNLTNLSNATPGGAANRSEAEFEEFLGSIGWSSAYCRGVAAETQEPLLEADVQRPELPPVQMEGVGRAELAPARGMAFRYAFATILVLGVVFRHPLESVVADGWSRLAGQSQEEAQARALLTKAHFASLLPGTSADEVRERVGLPASRGSGAMLKAEEAWYYSVAAEDSGAPVHVYLVALTRNKVVCALEITALRSSGQVPNPRQCAPRYLGDLRMIHRGKRGLLSYKADRATILVGASSEMPALPKADLKIVQPERLAVATSGASVEAPPLALYWRGVLYPLPVSPPGIPPGVLEADLKWLFRTIGCDKTGRHWSPVERNFPPSTPG